MDRSKLRISKACQECRLRKIRCDGGEPCQRCQFRDIPCEYRKKARNRMKKSDLLGAAGARTSQQSHAGHRSDDGYNSHSHSQDNSPRPPRPPYYASAALGRHSQRISSADTPTSSPGGRSNSLQNHSVAATHRASPGVFLQLYYGPSSNFSLLNSIYHRIEGRRLAEAREAKRRKRAAAATTNGDGNGNEDDNEEHDEEEEEDDDDATKDVEEIGPGLDLFNNRRLYFGDLADGSETSLAFGGNGTFTDGASMFVDRALAERLLERYLHTFWLILPIWTRDTFRQRLAGFYEPSSLLASGDPNTIIVLLALALGASMLEEELTAQYLYHMAKRWASALDEMVNVQTVQISLMMSHYASERARPNSSFLQVGTAVRKAVAAGLHKGVGGSSRGNTAKQSPDAARQMRITVWSLYFWETWLCFSLGRPSSFPESEMDVPFPTEEKLLFSVVTLARIMSKSATAIYRRHHDSLLPLWNAANEIRRELRAFAEQQREDFNFGVIDDPNAGELGVCQTIVSTLYHHTLILTFRPFLVLRATLRQEDSEGTGHAHPPPPPWLDTAVEYCLDAARHSIAFLIRAFEKNEMCRAIRYHGFFIEGASHVLAFELLNNVNAAGREANLHWIQLAIRALQLVMVKHKYSVPFPVDISSNLERMIQSVYPDFRADQVTTSVMLPSIPSVFNDSAGQATSTGTATLDSDANMTGQDDTGLQAKSLYGSAAGVVGGTGGANTASSFTVAQQQQAPQASQVSQASQAAHAAQTQQPQQQQQQQQSLMMAPLPPAISSVPTPPTIPTIGNGGISSGLLHNGGGNPGAGGGSNTLNLTDLSSLSNLSNALPPLLFPFTPFGGLDESSTAGAGTTAPSTQSPHMGNSGGGAGASGQGTGTAGDAAPADLTAADLGWDFDFGTMNMEAFLSIDPAMPYSF
ncbi:hypothetical protein SEUCBS139899_003241 [Sporothrix eucalyptigena]|uniref:Zn(2)-C6 fungal-type domain-containing protein n=1 Tax=Sporothrix eucalyptigena TaxID=1812306 RepID=A0ABP0BTS5_9PEZI